MWKKLKSKLFRIVVAIAAGYIAGAYVLGQLATGVLGTLSSTTVFAASGFAGGFASGFVLTGGDLGASLKLGAAGALTVGTFGTLGGSGFGTRLIGNGIAGGTSSKFLGGSFQRGAVLAALTVSASELVTRVTGGVKPTFRAAKGEPVLKPNKALRDSLGCGSNNLPLCDVIKGGVPNTGAALTTGIPGNIGMTFADAGLPESGFISRLFSTKENNPLLEFLAKVVPGVNSASVFHDNYIGQLGRNVSRIFENQLVNASTIPPAFAFDAIALGIPQIREDVRLVEDEGQ